MRTKDTILLEAAYDKVNQRKLQAFKEFANTLYVVVNGEGFDGYKRIGYTRYYDIAKAFTDDPERWIVKSDKPYFITSNHDYEIEIYAEGNSLADLVKEINSWGAHDEDFTEESLINSVNTSSYNGDSSFGWILFANGNPIARADNAEIHNLDEEYA